METPKQPVMIYHVPFVLKSDRKSGSAIRPQRMCEAFQALGYRVMAIDGTSRQRKYKFSLVQKYVEAGGKVDFCYSEASTMPNALTDADHLPRHPLIDYFFFRWCSKKRIPIGVFYRDIYWKYPEYLDSVNRFVALGTRSLYRADLIAYQRYIDVLFLPSLLMGKEIPIVSKPRQVALPPGAQLVDSEVNFNKPFTIFYVGGLGGPYYQMHELFKAVNHVREARLICCVPESQWATVSQDYGRLVGDSVTIVHAQGPELERYYKQAHCASLLVEPSDYRAFASPIKMYEYIGHGKPILATAGTLTGEFVKSEHAGWSVNYSCEAIATQLRHIIDKPSEYEAMVAGVRNIQENHTWLARARQVVEELATQE